METRPRIVRSDDPAPSPGQVQVVLPPGLLYNELRRLLVLVAGLVLLWRLAVPIASLLLFFLLVFIVSAVLNPVAVWMQGRGIPRVMSAIVLVLSLVGAVVVLAWLAVPPLLEEIGNLFGQFEGQRNVLIDYYERVLRHYPWLAGQLPPPDELFRDYSPDLTILLGYAGRYALGLAVGLFSIVLLLVLVIYSVAHPEPLIAGLLAAAPEEYRGRVETVLLRSMEQLKHWFYGVVLVGSIIGTLTGVGLHFLGVPHALLFGVIAGFGEFLPWVGPYLAAFPAIVFAFSIDPWLALRVVLFLLVVQQLENHVITPNVMSETLKMHPVSLIFVMLVMHSLFGILGALLAMPVSVILKVCWQEFYLKPKRTDEDEVEAAASEIIQQSAEGETVEEDAQETQAGESAASSERP